MDRGLRWRAWRLWRMVSSLLESIPWNLCRD
jgi:hypothetical protein